MKSLRGLKNVKVGRFDGINDGEMVRAVSFLLGIKLSGSKGMKNFFREINLVIIMIRLL